MMKKLLATLAVSMLFSTNAVAQTFDGIYSNTSFTGSIGNLGLAGTNGPEYVTVGNPTLSFPSGFPTVVFSPNNNQTTATTNRVTATYTDQQYTDTVNGGNPSMIFGADSNNSAKTLSDDTLLIQLDDVGDPADSYFSPTVASIGTGIDGGTTYAFEHYVSTEALLEDQFANQTVPYFATGEYYMGKLTYTFTEPVDYPILHVSGLGGYVTTSFPGGVIYQNSFSVDLELATGQTATGLAQLSGTSHTVVDGTPVRIRNDYNINDVLSPGGTDGVDGDDAGTGSFVVLGTGIQTVTFNVIMVAKNQTPTGIVPSLWSTIPNDPNPKYTGDRFATSWTLPYDDPTAVTMGDVGLVARGLTDFLDDLGARVMSAPDLLALLRAWDPMAAAKLERAGPDVLQKALRDYLDPDGDGRVVVFRWETLEERGTIGFYAERSQGGVWSPINAEMLPGLIAAPMGAQYWLADPGAQAGDNYQYRLIEVEARGGTNVYGPFDLQTTTP